MTVLMHATSEILSLSSWNLSPRRSFRLRDTVVWVFLWKFPVSNLVTSGFYTTGRPSIFSCVEDTADLYEFREYCSSWGSVLHIGLYPLWGPEAGLQNWRSEVPVLLARWENAIGSYVFWFLDTVVYVWIERPVPAIYNHITCVCSVSLGSILCMHISFARTNSDGDWAVAFLFMKVRADLCPARSLLTERQLGGGWSVHGLLFCSHRPVINHVAPEHLKM